MKASQDDEYPQLGIVVLDPGEVLNEEDDGHDEVCRGLSITPYPHDLMHAQFCSLCNNGGPTVACDRCPRVVCTSHLSGIEDISPETLLGLEYVCPSCHVMTERSGTTRGPYMVSASAPVLSVRCL